VAGPGSELDPADTTLPDLTLPDFGGPDALLAAGAPAADDASADYEPKAGGRVG
jgi:hypothetical protein